MIINVSSVNASSSLLDPLASKNLFNASSTSSPKLLVELASEQKHVNYHLCLFHYQLIRILYLIAKYNMKSVKTLSFFDTKVSLLNKSAKYSPPTNILFIIYYLNRASIPYSPNCILIRLFPMTWTSKY